MGACRAYNAVLWLEHSGSGVLHLSRIGQLMGCLTALVGFIIMITGNIFLGAIVCAVGMMWHNNSGGQHGS